MPIINADTAQQFARAWIEAWNQHDLDAVLSHYADDFELSSPFISSIAGEPSGTLQGKAAVGAYWSKALERIPDLHFELRNVLTGVDSITLYYQGHRGMAAEVFLLNGAGKVVKSLACYAVA